MSVKQLKLTNGEEIFCNVQDETEHDVIATGVLLLRELTDFYDEFEDEHQQSRLFSLYPWMTYQTELTQVILINKRNIVGSIIPSTAAQEYYVKSLDCLTQVVELHSSGKNLDSGSRGNVLRFPKVQK
jgi:hypothetical protein